MGRRLQIDRVIVRVAAAYTAIVFAVMAAFGIAAFAFIARMDADALRPVMDLPVGQAAYRDALVRAALAIAAVEGLLLIVVAGAAYALAVISTAPLRAARERERQFAADAAHELRTPLARIAAVAQAAQGAAADERARALETITTTALAASALIGDLLTLARAEHVPPAICEPVDIGSLAREVTASYADVRSDVRFTLDVADGTFVDGDALRLRRLLANLIDNAVRHARAAVAVEVHAGPTRATIAIADDGAGVEPGQRERIFERFVTTTSGTGLGLPMVRWIARAHGGDVVLLEPSRFVADLPLTGTGTLTSRMPTR